MRLLSMMLVMAVALPGWGQGAGKKGKPQKGAAAVPDVPLRQQERAEQVLSRFTFGARPGDVERVMAQGVDAWFEQQMTPEKIADPVVERRLNDLPTIRMTPEQALTDLSRSWDGGAGGGWEAALSRGSAADECVSGAGL